MKHLTNHAGHAAATAHLAELRAAEEAALKDEAHALESLAQPSEQESALAAAGRLLRGEPSPGVDSAAQAARLADARQRLRLLRAAIAEQQSAIAAIRGGASGAVCAAALPRHLEAAGGIVDALEGLRAALAAEAAVRAEILAAGYVCSLEPLGMPELDFEDPASAPQRMLRDVRKFVEVNRLRAGKGAAVLLLVDAPGLGLAGDVVRADGPAAAALVAAGRGEQTDRKPGRAQRQDAGAELLLS